MPIHTKQEMGDFKGFLTVSPPPSPSPSDNSRLAILCYGLVVVGTAAIVLAVYSLIIIKRRGRRHLQSQPIRLVEVVTASSSTENSQTSFLSSFKYKKEAAEKENGVGGDDDYECPVCLSAYEEGEENTCKDILSYPAGEFSAQVGGIRWCLSLIAGKWDRWILWNFLNKEQPHKAANFGYLVCDKRGPTQNNFSL
ncbi:uncharacterized protein LOC130713576 [Lotus japonicus]|uniref:uncharacterized protein LOC130713576 n=1 Tax=Lotus japonicus TaxID=34305 RepID=UPI002587D364|nr:uncharacterized protein LOC130713576 [Lotus japonicus]